MAREDHVLLRTVQTKSMVFGDPERRAHFVQVSGASYQAAGAVLFTGGRLPTDLTIYDKYIGRAAALLMVSLKPTQIMTPIISEGGTACLAEHGLSFTAEQQVKYLMGVASEDMCRWEKQALGKSPEQFYSEVISQ